MNHQARILIVDDDPHLRTTLIDILHHKGFAPIPAHTGSEALRHVQERAVDVAVIDLRLEDMSGLELLRNIKSRFPDTECIVLTGHASQSSAIESVNSGVYAYLQKPFDIEQFLLLLRRAVERRTTAQALRQSEEMHRVTLENISDAVLITDDNGNFTYVGPNTHEIFGCSQAEVVQMGSIETLLGPPPPPISLADKDEIRNVEWRICTATSEERVVLVNVKRVSIREGTRLYTFRDITERKQAEAATLREQQLVASMLESLPGIFYLVDAQVKFLRWNKRLEQVSGYSADEIRQMSPLNFFASEDEEILADRIRQVFTVGYADIEAHLIAKNGERTPYHFTGSLAHIDHELRLVGMGIDISERVHSGRALQRQLQDLTVLHRVTVTCAEATHPDELIASVTQIIGEALYPDHLGVLLLDAAAERLIPHLSYRGVNDDVQQIWPVIPLGEGIVGQVVSSGSPIRVADVRQTDNYLNIHPSTCSELCVPIAIGGRILGVINAESALPNFFGDDDERLLLTIAGQLATALERLRLFVETGQRAEQIEQIIRSVPDGMLLLDEDHRLLQVNPAGRDYLALLGHGHSSEARGKQRSEDKVPGEGDILTRLGNQPLMHLLTSPVGGRWHEIQQNRRIFETLAHPLAAGPTPSGWVVLLRDVTRQREVQEQLQRQERLAAVGQLAAGIAHDFNNLMGAILLHAHLLGKSTSLTDKERERLSIIHGQARHASAMIEQILDFSRRSVLESQPLDLLPLLKEHVKLLQRTLPEHISVDLIERGSDYIVLADPTRIQQIVMNLAINARDAMPKGGSFTLQLDRLHLERTSDLPLTGMSTGDWVRLSVRDTGIGMSPEILDHLFEPFFTTKAPGKGTGLGLAQVYGIVGQHKGHITVHSQLGEGALFNIYLPALTTTGQAAAVSAEEDLLQGEGQLVLVVEDNASLRAALADYLDMRGYRVLTAVDGSEALEMWTRLEETPALVLSDVVMPHMGGVALVHALRRQGNQTPIILITGHPLDEMEMQVLRSQGVSGWLTKPLNLPALAAAITNALAPRD
jgi:PAS domain S-box-containing protein